MIPYRSDAGFPEFKAYLLLVFVLFLRFNQAGLRLPSGFICYKMCSLCDQKERSLHTAVCISV
jgi:hypothetical protein